ncbi:MAG: SET domain-containing protein [Candidatus Pacebacteria bacterium]|nr:SET domain-containing protein [Candidatus Paceibacterota bacterium]
MPDVQKENLKVKRSSAGLGLYTLVPIPKGSFIIEYVGEHISHDESDRRGGKYLFTLSDKIVIDGKARTNTARYINHSCRPNCEAESDEEALKIRILAKRTIKAGEELTIDYGKEYWNDHIKPYGCRCAVCTTQTL